ncbi:MAG: glyoxalase [Gammaproteobacteria bacterium]|nr:glyoxalase [Gammaproteobacteria bacterium]
MIEIRPLLFGATLLSSIAFLEIFIAILAGAETTTGPQLLTLSSLLGIAGYFSAKQASDAGILHGMVAGLIGGLLIVVGLEAFSSVIEGGLVDHLAAKRHLMYLALGGLWGALGGMIREVVIGIKAKRARRLAAEAREKENSG